MVTMAELELALSAIQAANIVYCALRAIRKNLSEGKLSLGERIIREICKAHPAINVNYALDALRNDDYEKILGRLYSSGNFKAFEKEMKQYLKKYLRIDDEKEIADFQKEFIENILTKIETDPAFKDIKENIKGYRIEKIFEMVERIVSKLSLDYKPLLTVNEFILKSGDEFIDSEFVGREEDKKSIEAFIESKNKNVLVMHGEGGIGKTRLLIEFARRKENVLFVNSSMILMDKTGEGLKELILEIREQGNKITILDDYQKSRDIFNNLVERLFPPEDVLKIKLITATRTIFLEEIKQLNPSRFEKYEVIELSIPQQERLAHYIIRRLDLFYQKEIQDAQALRGKVTENFSNIVKLSGFNPYLVHLCFKYLEKYGTLEGVHTHDKLIDGLLKDLEKGKPAGIELEEIFEVLSSVALIRYINKKGIRDLEELFPNTSKILEFLNGSGYIIYDSKLGVYFIGHDVFSDYLIKNRLFSEIGITRTFNEIVKNQNFPYPLETLSILLDLRRDDENSCFEAIEILFQKIKDSLNAKTMIDLAINAYYGLNSKRIIEKTFGEDFWKRNEEIEDEKVEYYYKIGVYLYLTGYLKDAKAIFERIIEISTDETLKAYSFHMIAMIHQEKGEYKEAMEKYNESMKIEEELGDRSGIAITLHQIGNIHYQKGEYEEAIKKYEESMRIKEELGDRRGKASTLELLGLMYLELGRPEKAVEYFEQALEIFQKLGLKSKIEITEENITKAISQF